MAEVTKSEVLIRAMRLLEVRLPDFANRIFLVINDEIPPSVQDRDVITVQITGGTFDWGTMAGSGRIVEYHGTLRVAVWCHNRVDKAGTANSILMASNRGLLRLETKILNALTGSYLQEADVGGDSFEPILLDTIKPLSDTEPQSAGKGEGVSRDMKASLAVDFSVHFQWNLAGDRDEEPLTT